MAGDWTAQPRHAPPSLASVELTAARSGKLLGHIVNLRLYCADWVS